MAWIDNEFRTRLTDRIADWTVVGYNVANLVTLVAGLAAQVNEGVAMLFARQEMLRRVRILRNAKLVLDVLFMAFLIWQEPLMLPLAALAVDLLFLLVIYPRWSQKEPFAAVLMTLALTALAVILAGVMRPDLTPFLLAMYVPLPAAAAVALGSTAAIQAAAGLASGAIVISSALFMAPLSGNQGTPSGVYAWTGLTLVAVWLQALALHRLALEERRQQDAIDQVFPVASGLMVAVVNDAIFDAHQDHLSRYLKNLVDRQGIRWLVLDLNTSAVVSPAEIDLLTAAAQSVANCKIVLARVPAEAVLRPGAPALLQKRLDHFATVTQAVEVGLRQLGWVHPSTTPEAREARQPIRVPTSVVTEDWWDKE